MGDLHVTVRADGTAEVPLVELAELLRHVPADTGGEVGARVCSLCAKPSAAAVCAPCDRALRAEGGR